MKKKALPLCLIFMLLFSFSAENVWAETANPRVLTIQSAVRLGLENSILLQQLRNKIANSDLKSKAANEMGNDLTDGQNDVDMAQSEIYDAETELDSAQYAINNAKIDIANGRAPEAITVAPGVVIAKGADIEDSLRNILQFQGLSGAVLESQVQEKLSAIVAGIDSQIAINQRELDEKKTEYERSRNDMLTGTMDFKIAKATITAALADKLDVSELDDLSARAASSMLVKMADASKKVITASEGIYRNQIALQIQNSYYDVLKAKKMLEVKENAVKRGEAQYNFAKDGYESGFKAKDDMLLANIYYTGAQLELQKARNDYNNALIELKKNLNIPLTEEVVLEDVLVDSKPPVSYSSGLENGLNNRLEIIKAKEECDVYQMDADLVKTYYGADSDRYLEAQNLKKNMDLELSKAKQEVESSIKESYNTMTTLEQMLQTSRDMVSQAEECLDIARSKYEEGYDADSSLLKQLDLESTAGTAMEVISAQENLSQVEEKYVEILYNYNLAKAKYLNDIAYLTY
ncbi:MAG: TolC family protein [Clostridiales bacterium]|nr:TolC family protein [Eubacteriales bacterium]MDH7567244.1 TolC family protein [Clostridiales bacterium]